MKPAIRQLVKSASERTLRKYQEAFTPILISRKARKNYRHEEPIASHPFMSTGTGIFVIYKSKKWLITANHVISNIENDHHSAPIYVRNGGAIEPLFRDSEKMAIIRMAKEDVAVIPLFLDAGTDYTKSLFLNLDQIPTTRFSEQFRIGVYGYLKKLHTSVGGEIIPSQYLSKIGSKSDAITASRVHTEFNRRAFEGDVIDKNFVPEPDGLSGGPVFALGTAHEIQSNSNQIGDFCGLFITQSDAGKHGDASFVPLECLKDCIEESISAMSNPA